MKLETSQLLFEVEVVVPNGYKINFRTFEKYAKRSSNIEYYDVIRVIMSSYAQPLTSKCTHYAVFDNCGL